MEKNAFGSGKAGIKKDQLIIIVKYIGRSAITTGGDLTKNKLNARIKEWYDVYMEPEPALTDSDLPETKL
eukprot:scaffold12145_cov139-Amphora_coffeaeformis.AAC.5